ncbi:MAG: ABC transporter permease [Mogibacterium sp.]|nr:ABC transporter permease [Mogibacterium sp.]
MKDIKENKDPSETIKEELQNANKIEEQINSDSDQYSLNDDRRVKVLSPGQLVAKRFIRNRLAVTGMVILLIMFIFSFIGGLLSPYDQDQKFYRVDARAKDYAGVLHNEEYRYTIGDKDLFKSSVNAQALKAIITGKDSFDYNGVSYTLEQLGDEVFTVSTGGKVIGIVSKELVNSSTQEALSFDFTLAAFQAKSEGKDSFTADGAEFKLGEDGIITDAAGNEKAYISAYIVKAVMSDVFFTREFKNQLIDAVEAGEKSFKFTDADGQEAEYILSYDAATKGWDVKQEIDTKVFDTYSAPSKEHWLGTDRNGMDMLTRLMYGGRISLMIGFIVVFLETFLGIIMGGISGYFGGWIDGLIMRIVDVFYCIPSMPIIIILGAAMDAANLPSLTRMIYLMLILGFLGWAGVARLVRGQILSLREQEFMTATEACGIAPSRRIFRHLIPNVMPQLIVYMTMGLGSTIILEATLSFLGLGVRFPFASWGNIINDVNDTFVLTNYWFIWIPAGVLLLVTVLAFNIVGDGLRDAFDPKMKR